ncbi:ABC transporter substrate-binding protein [Planotetraspora phitsanulokensis]|uniref:ABC transporter substrate-binding protein n=1 Tax=Planotetraspora phitsanulokensis TaxID=575192 RepID=A0A8J3UDL2_9ACTN|nr:ABC transporter substrate-binding protein [Planotetraspora phitsanulokensis]GII43543.1 ABC transporter substrate-binding protein [Planotetraspora phitsanulokensis]
MPPMNPLLTRRSVLAGLGFTGAALLTGCTSAVSLQAGSPANETSKGGTLRAGIGQDLIPGNFFTNSNSGITTLIGLVYEGLIRYPNDRVAPTPRLATSWQMSADGRALTLTLRQGVTFHTGRPFTSKDVEFSLRTYAEPVWNGQLRSTAAAITSYDTSDPQKVVLHLAHPLGNIFDLLDTVPIVDSETFDGVGTGRQYVGTGPFRFVSWTPNSQLRFAKNPKYWQPGLPYLDNVNVSVVPDPTSLTSQLRSGQIDYAYGNSYLDIEQLAATKRFTKHQLAGAEQQIYVGTNITAPALSDIRVRQAIAYAIDRERIMSEVFRNSGYAVNLPWPKYSNAYDANKNTTYALDTAKASALVKEYGKPIAEIPLAYSAQVPLYRQTAQIVQANLQAVGIPVTLDPLDGAQFVKRLIGAEFPGMWTTFHSWAQYTPSTLTVSAYPFNAAKNSSHYSSAQYSSDATQAWQVADGGSEEAVGHYGRLSDDLLSALFLIEIGVVQPQWVTSNRLRGVSYTKRQELDLTRAALSV